MEDLKFNKMLKRLKPIKTYEIDWDYDTGIGYLENHPVTIKSNIEEVDIIVEHAVQDYEGYITEFEFKIIHVMGDDGETTDLTDDQIELLREEIWDNLQR